MSNASNSGSNFTGTCDRGRHGGEVRYRRERAREPQAVSAVYSSFIPYHSSLAIYPSSFEGNRFLGRRKGRRRGGKIDKDIGAGAVEQVIDNVLHFAYRFHGVIQHHFGLRLKEVGILIGQGETGMGHLFQRNSQVLGDYSG